MELSVSEERYAEEEGAGFTRYLFKQGKRELRAQRYHDEAERVAITEHRRWRASGWSEWSAFERIPYFDPLFCAVVRRLFALEGVERVELLLPVHTQRYQPILVTKLQF
jgi:hypothetical protein